MNTFRLQFILVSWWIGGATVLAQSGFELPFSKSKVTIPFQLINNLIFIPVELNGVPLTFLLDSGVEETILFSLDPTQEVALYQVDAIKLKGLGSKDAIDAYKSSHNVVKINGYTDTNHELYVVLDQEFNFSSHVGIPVNGIIGYHFFKNHKIEINYSKKRVIVYADTKKSLPQYLKRFPFSDSLQMERNKPYLHTPLYWPTQNRLSKMLVDTGNSDALWVMVTDQNRIPIPSNTIEDYLGRGFSGEVFGKRGRITAIEFANVRFEEPLATFPDSLSLKSVTLAPQRIGSIGGEMLSRFDVLLDYRNQRFYARPNSKVTEPFQYNMSGIEIEHSGIEWVSEPQVFGSSVSINTNSTERIWSPLQTKFQLQPIFRIYTVRKDSNAEKAGLQKGDRIKRINGKSTQNMTIQSLNDLLKSEEGLEITLEIERNGILLKKKFVLQKLI